MRCRAMDRQDTTSVHCLLVYDLPTFEVLDGSATGTAVAACAGNAGFEHTSQPDHLYRNAFQGYFQPSAPAAVGLASTGPDIHVHEALSRWPLYKGSAHSSHAVRDAIPDRRLKFKSQVVSLGPLLLNRLVGAAPALLQCEIDAGGRLLDNDSKSKSTSHTSELIKQAESLASVLIPPYVGTDAEAPFQKVKPRCRDRLWRRFQTGGRGGGEKAIDCMRSIRADAGSSA